MTPSPVLPLFLAQTAADASELADIRDPIHLIDWMFWGALALVAVLVAILLWRWQRRRARERSLAPSGPPPPPPGVWARAELDRLDREQAQFADKAFIGEVSLVVREYLERALQLPAPERTTEEFLHELRTHPLFTDAMRADLGQFLSAADMVKFAAQALGEDQRPAFLDQARQLVDTTENAAIPRPAEEASA